MDRLKAIKERSEIMSVLLSKSTAYWTYIDKILKSPLILTSSGLVIINSYFQEGDDNIKLYNVIFNGLNLVLMGLLNNLDLSKKIENLKTKSTEFYQFSHMVDADILTDNISNDRVIFLQDKYDLIMQFTDVGSIPDGIKNKVRKEYEGKKVLPLILNGLLNGSPIKAVNAEEV